MNRILKNFVCTGTMLCDASARNGFEKNASVPSQFESKRSRWIKTESLDQNVSCTCAAWRCNCRRSGHGVAAKMRWFRFDNYHCTVSCIR